MAKIIIKYSLFVTLTVCMIFVQSRGWSATSKDSGTSDMSLVSVVVEGVEPFSDELAAMQAYKENPDDGNRKTLADIRYNHAIGLYNISEDKPERDAFAMSLYYAEAAALADPANARNWSLVGQLYAKAGDSPAAVSMAENALRTALEIHPQSLKSRLLLGTILYKQERYDAAMEQIESAIRQDPEAALAEVVYMLNMAYVMDFQYARGEVFWAEILKRTPDNDNMRFAYAILLHQQGKEEPAEKQLDIIIEKNGPDDPNYNYALELMNVWRIERDWDEE